MRTVLDVTVCAHSRGGVGRWMKGLAKGLTELSREHVSIDLPETHPGVTCDVPGVIGIPQPRWMVMPFIRRLMLSRGRMEASRAERIRSTVGLPDIMHLSGVQPLGSGKMKVVTFYDDTPWTDPGSHTEDTLRYAGNLADLVRGGAAVLAISRWAAERAASTLGVPSELTGVAGGAAEDLFTPGDPDREFLKANGLRQQGYMLHVGSFVPRKNIPFLLDCFRKASPAKTKLVLAGAERWGLEGETGNSENVLVMENLSDRDLLSLYRGAQALVVPSVEEGLGLPVLEAFACGTPVISSDGGALPDTVGENGLILPASHGESWIRALSSPISDTMRNMASAAFRPTWRTVAERAMSFYRGLI